jgi:hypothetical protein
MNPENLIGSKGNNTNWNFYSNLQIIFQIRRMERIFSKNRFAFGYGVHIAYSLHIHSEKFLLGDKSDYAYDFLHPRRSYHVHCTGR